MVAIVLASVLVRAQSSMPFSFLPPGFVPGVSLMPTKTPVAKNPGDLILSSKNFEFHYSLILLGVKQESAYENYNIVSFRIYSLMKYRISDDLILWVEPFLIFRTGSDQSASGNSHSGTVFIPKDASLIWTPAAWFQLRGGVLDQNFVHSFLMLEDQAFPGIRSTMYFGDGDLRGSWLAEQSIITFSSNTNSTNQIEQTPTLTSTTFESHYTFDRHDQIKLSLGYWQYDNLPSSVAAESMLNGNTVDRVSDSYSAFTYKFRGYEARTRLELNFGRFDLNLYSEGIYNSAAPKGLNTGYSAGNELSFRSTPTQKFGMSAEYFHVEPDAAVSSFNAVEFDRSNRNGMMIQPYFQWGKRQSKISLRYVTSNLIYTNAPQSEVTQFRIRWETAYDML